jgi:hypothetical protein
MRLFSLDPHKVLGVNRIELQVVLDESVMVFFKVGEQLLDHFHFVLLEFDEGFLFGQVLAGFGLLVNCGVVFRVAVEHVQAEDQLAQLEVDIFVGG